MGISAKIILYLSCGTGVFYLVGFLGDLKDAEFCPAVLWQGVFWVENLPGEFTEGSFGVIFYPGEFFTSYFTMGKWASGENLYVASLPTGIRKFAIPMFAIVYAIG